MKRNKWVYLSVLLLTTVLVMGFATFCMAAGDASAPVEAPRGMPPAFGNLYVIGWTAVNFFILLAILYKFAYNPINNMMEQRTNSIESNLRHAEEVRTEVEQMRKEAQTNLSESRKEAQDIVAKSTKAAENVKNEMIAKANEEAASIKTKAHAEIVAATEQAKMELRDSAVTLAIIAAERVLSRAITSDDHKKMVREFIDEAGDLLC